MVNKSRKNMKKISTLIESLYPLGKYVLRVCFSPRHTSAPGHFVAPPRTFPPQNMSGPGGGHRYQVMVIIYCNIVALKTTSPNVYGQITLNNGKERMEKVTSRERRTRLCNMGNQTDSDDATWIWINSKILAIRGCPTIVAQQEQHT